MASTRRGRVLWCAVLSSVVVLLVAGTGVERAEAGQRTVQVWLGRVLSPGDLAKAHAKLEGLTGCVGCHSLGRGVPDGRCLDCHEALRKRIAERRGYHAASDVAGKRCTSCHTDHRGRGYDILALDEARFPHEKTGYLLERRHSSVACRDCHSADRQKSDPRAQTYLGLRPDCAGCHRDVHQGVRGMGGATLGKRCETCHGVERWTPSESFWTRIPVRHDRTRYPLEGLHAEVPCQACHPSGKLTMTEFGQCIACHSDPHKAQFARARCSECHDAGAKGWKPSTYEHAKPGYRLTGVHMLLSCAECHPQGKYRPLGTACQSCHPAYGEFFDRRGVLEPPLPHPPDRMPKDVACVRCHGAGFRHSPVKAVERECERCHPSLYEEWLRYRRSGVPPSPRARGRDHSAAG